MGSTLRATIPVDNAKTPGLCVEWGLSVHIVYGERSLLLDFCQSDAFARNAKDLGIDPGRIDAAVLSRAHPVIQL